MKTQPTPPLAAVAQPRLVRVSLSDDVIPKGCYCYDENGNCPYWHLFKSLPKQENGYCHRLKAGDWEIDRLSLLWDQVKECGINDDEDISSANAKDMPSAGGEPPTTQTTE